MLKELRLDLPAYYDPQSATRTAVDRLTREEDYPLTVLLDRRGVLRAVWVGYWPGAETEMERYIGMVLEEKGMLNDEIQMTNDDGMTMHECRRKQRHSVLSF